MGRGLPKKGCRLRIGFVPCKDGVGVLGGGLMKKRRRRMGRVI